MLTYPNLIASSTGWELDSLAEASGLPPDIIAAVLSGGVAAALAVRARLARVLGADPVELFRLPPEMEAILAGAPARHVSDPATLRAIDSRDAA